MNRVRIGLQLEFDVGGMVPLVLWDDSLFDGSPVKLAPANALPTPGSARQRAAVEEPFAGRYTAVLLTYRTSPGKGTSPAFNWNRNLPGAAGIPIGLNFGP
jgi:hypothetical protein